MRTSYVINTGFDDELLRDRTCIWCGIEQIEKKQHPGVCPRIQTVEFHRDGSVARVTLFREEAIAAALRQMERA